MATFVPTEIRPPPSINNSDDDDEDSFEVLGKSISADIESILSTTKNDVIENEIFKETEKLLEKTSQLSSLPTVDKCASVLIAEKSVTTSNQFSFGGSSSIVSHFSTYDEIQKHIEEISEENRRLHKQIADSNENMRKMKENLNKVADWQEEIQKTHEINKAKFAEAKLYTDNLKLEITKLRLDVEKYKNIKELTESEMLSLKEKLKQIEDNASSSTSGAAAAVTETVEKDDDKQINEYINKIENLEKQLEELKIQKNENQSNEFNQKMFEALEEKLKIYEKQIQELESEKIILTKKNEDLYSYYDKNIIKMQLNQYERREKSLIDECEKLKLELTKKDDNDKEQLIELQQQLVKAQMNITELKNELKDTKIILETKSNEMLEAEQKFKEYEEKLKEYEGKLKENDNINDEIFALREQLELYKSDFEIERNAVIELKKTRDDIVNEMHNVQRRNEQLQDEIELIRDRGFVVHPQISNNRPTGAVPRTTPTAPRENHTYTCPKCSFTFRDLQTLQNHVDRCLDLNETLP